MWLSIGRLISFNIGTFACGHQTAARKNQAVSPGEVFYIHRAGRNFFSDDHSVGAQHPLGQSASTAEK